MLFAKKRDIKLRTNLNKKELLQNSFKYVRTNFLGKIEKKEKIPFFFNDFHFKNNSKVKLVRRCVLNNRSRGLTKPYNVSRIKLRELIQFGIVPGYKKSV